MSSSLTPGWLTQTRDVLKSLASVRWHIVEAWRVGKQSKHANSEFLEAFMALRDVENELLLLASSMELELQTHTTEGASNA